MTLVIVVLKSRNCIISTKEKFTVTQVTRTYRTPKSIIKTIDSKKVEHRGGTGSRSIRKRYIHCSNLFKKLLNMCIAVPLRLFVSGKLRVD